MGAYRPASLAAWREFLLGGVMIDGSAVPVSKLITEVFPPLLASGLRVAFVANALSPVLVAQRGEIGRMTRR